MFFYTRVPTLLLTTSWCTRVRLWYTFAFVLSVCVRY